MYKVMTRLHTLISFLLPALPSIAFAGVNFKDGSYLHTAIDIEVSQQQHIFELRRTYSSRSLHSGLFGFGWCSDLEKNLDLRRSDQISLRDCRLPSEVVFKKKKPGVFENSDNPDDTILLQNHQFLRRTLNSTQTFTLRGQLQNLSDKTGFHLRLFYDSRDILQKIQLNDQAEIFLKFDPTRRRIQTLLGPRKTRIEYSYHHSDLISANTTNYVYDKVHNLTQIQFEDGSSERMTYDPRNDRVETVTDRKGCSEKVHYSQGNPSLQDIVSSEKKCPGRPTEKSIYRFWYKTDAQGRSYLANFQRRQKNQSSKNVPTTFQLSGGPTHDP